MTLSELFGHSKRHGLKWWRHAVDHIWPHERNSHHPHLLKHRALVGYSVFLILVKVLVIVAPIALPSSSLFSSAITPENIINLTNQTRINLGLSELKTNALLTLAAGLKADDMIVSQYFAHTSPSGISPWDWLKNSGYKYQYAGENLAVYFTSAEGVSDGWMASPSHRANIVNGNYTEIGVGVVNGTYNNQNTSMVVQMFGTPPGQKVTTAVATIPAAAPAPSPTPNANSQPESLVVSAPVSPTPATEAVTSQPPLPVKVPEVTAPQEPEVLPEPEEVVVPAEPLATERPSVFINTDSAQVARQGDSYNVSVPVAGAQVVTLHLASLSVNLVSGPGDLWSGTINFDPNTFSKNGEALTILAAAVDGTVKTQQLAWLAPDVGTQQLYNFNTGTDKYARFFGFITVHNLDDAVTRFYLYFVIALAAALLINIFVKIHIQRVSVIAHTTAVIALAFVLWMV